jgi:hypothetical protein
VKDTEKLGGSLGMQASTQGGGFRGGTPAMTYQISLECKPLIGEMQTDNSLDRG